MAKTHRFYYEQASADLTHAYGDVYLLKNLYSHTRHLGHAGKLMETIVDWANKNQKVLFLIVRAYGPPDIMNNAQLVEFYKKYGFEIDKEHQLRLQMVRYPSHI